ncbi:MAG: sigma-70 family RNA polymerase sigma factor [Ruminococcus sp.]|nr:sigma-70 family RNA polymerase sigma factor [Ruminococcus sp.]
MTDPEIISLIENSPRQGHRALFEEYYSYVYAITVNILRGYGSAEDIEECVIDSFASVINDLSGEALKPFIGTVTRNKALNMRRKLAGHSGRNISIDSDEFSELPSSERLEQNIEDSERTAFILQKIKELGEPDSTIIIQKYYYERNAKEIGRLTGMKAAAVRMRCSRAIKKLRSLLSGIS